MEYKRFIDSQGGANIGHEFDELDKDTIHMNTHKWIVGEFNRTLLRFEAFTCFIVLYDCIMCPFELSFGSKYFE